MRQTWSKRPRVVVPTVLLVAVLIAIAGALFQPWRLLVDNRVDEALPAAAPPQAQSGTASSKASPSIPNPSATLPKTDAQTRTPSPQAPSNKTIRSGELISHEHPTQGEIKIIQQPDGSRVLRIENLETTNGPDLRVWLSSAPVLKGRDGWFVFKNHDHLELGALKANQGNQNYAVPASADLDDFSSVTIWCKRFRVSFGAAELTAS